MHGREKSEERIAIFETFGEFLLKNNLPHEIISGSLVERVAKVDVTIYEYTGDKRIFENTETVNTHNKLSAGTI